MEGEDLETIWMKFGQTSLLGICESVEIKSRFIYEVDLLCDILFCLRSVANDRYSLWKLRITHVVNAAHGKMHCQGSHDFYGPTVNYYGIPADDSPSFNLSCYFFPSAEYIQKALNTNDGNVASLSMFKK